MSESTVLTLDIGGGSDEAVSAVSAVAEALQTLQTSAEGASQAASTTGDAVTQAGDQTAAAGQDAQGASQGFGEVGSSMETLLGHALGMNSGLAPLKSSFNELQSASKELSGTEGLGAIAGGAAAGVLALGGLAEAGAGAGNEIIKLTAITGMDQASVETWAHAYGMAGQSADSLGRTVLMIQGAMDQAAKGNAKYADTFASLDVSLTNADGSARAAGDVFQDLMATLANTEPAQRQADVVNLLGARYGAQLMPVLNNYNSIMPAAQQLTNQTSAAMENAAARALEYDKQTEILKTEVQALGVEALPVLNDALYLVAGGLQFAVMFSEGVVAGFHDIEGVVSSVSNAMVAAFKWADDELEKFQNDLHEATLGLAGHAAAAQQAATSTDQVASSTNEASGSESQYSDVISTTDSATQALSFSQLTLAQQLGIVGQQTVGGGMELQAYAQQMWDAQAAADALAASEADVAAQGASGTGGTPSGVPGRAAGGPVSAGSLYRVNENGTEYFRPSVSGDVIPLGAGPSSSGGGGGGQSVVIHNVYNIAPGFGDNVNDLMSQIDEHLREVLRDSTALRGYI